jgi:hypothetical protein
LCARRRRPPTARLWAGRPSRCLQPPPVPPRLPARPCRRRRRPEIDGCDACGGQSAIDGGPPPSVLRRTRHTRSGLIRHCLRAMQPLLRPMPPPEPAPSSYAAAVTSRTGPVPMAVAGGRPMARPGRVQTGWPGPTRLCPIRSMHRRDRKIRNLYIQFFQVSTFNSKFIRRRFNLCNCCSAGNILYKVYPNTVDAQ